MRRGEPTRASRWSWLAIVCSAAAAMVFAAPAAAATASVTSCSEVAIGYVFTFSGSGFASNTVVTASVDGAPRGTTVTDNRGNFSNFSVLVLSLPAEVVFVDAAGNSATLTVSACGGGGGDPGEPEPPEAKDACKLGGHDVAGFRNQGQCVRAVVAKKP